MKYPCDVIQDLLPLYYDEACSKESCRIVEEHIKECDNCKKMHEEISAVGSEIPHFNDYEKQKVNSFQKIKKMITRKQIISIIATIFALIVALNVAVTALKHSIQEIDNTMDISVTTVDGNIMARLQGSKWHDATMRRIETGGKTYIFFALTDTKWDRLVISSEMYSEYLICSKDKSADSVDEVYYYSGDYSDLEYKDINTLTEQSVLLWKK